MRNPLAVLGVPADQRSKLAWSLLEDPEVFAEWKRRNDALNAGDSELELELSSTNTKPAEVFTKALKRAQQEWLDTPWTTDEIKSINERAAAEFHEFQQYVDTGEETS